MYLDFAMRVLVVEDEIGVRRSLIGKLQNADLPIEVAGEAENAEEAYEKMKRDEPDIVLLDMRMPGMGGYRFLPILREQFPKVKVIVISGYSDFEYVRQSLQNGAVDYLLKPVDKEQLENVLGQTIGKIREERERSMRDIRNAMLLNQAVPLLRHQFSNRLLKPRSALSAAEKLAHLGVDLNDEKYGLFVARVVNVEDAKAQYGQEAALLSFVFENIVKDTLARPVVCFPREKEEGEFVCLLGLEAGGDAEEQLKAAEPQLRKLLSNMRAYGKMTARLVVGEPFGSLTEAGSVYRKAAELAATDGGAEGALRYAGSGSREEEAEERRLKAFVETIEERDTGEITRWIRGLFEASGHPAATASLLCNVLEQAVERLFADPDGFAPQFSELSRLLKAPGSAAEWPDKLAVLAVQIKETASKRGQGESKQIIAQARRYIEKNYFEDITLESLAQMFYLNRTYFSALFKKESGWTFKKYLNHVRIENAKRLLVEHELRPSVVAELVGVKDQVYFTVLFKKMTGLPPGEYQKSHVPEPSPISENNRRSPG